MHDMMDEQLQKIRRSRIRKKRLTAVLLILSLLAALDVFWVLRQPAETMSPDADCGIAEHIHNEQCGIMACVCGLAEGPHVHDESCYQMQTAEKQLVCQLTEASHEHTEDCYSQESEEAAEVLICDLTEAGHSHETVCYEWQQLCGKTEHVHNADCFTDEMADTETMLDWQKMFENYPYTGNLREDLVGIARTQAGYAESQLNFAVGSDGIRRGYTRYGAWYGAPYSDWSSMFVSYCLHYAGADPEDIPGNSGASTMAERWEKQERFIPAGEYVPAVGDLVFFKDHTVGIVTEVQNGTFYAICGDINDMVSSMTVSLSQETIAGWGSTEGIRSVKEQPSATTETEESLTQTEPESEASATEESMPQADPESEVPATEESQPQPDLESEVPGTEASMPLEDPKPTAPEKEEDELLDISNGPAVSIFVGDSREELMQTFVMRSSRTIIDLIPYLENRNGSYFFTLLDNNNQELPKDDAGNYIVQAETGYKLTLTINNPEGFVPGTYQYQIPNGLLVDGGEGSFVLKDGTNVGSWIVTDEGLITLSFNEHINSRTDITISATLGIHFPLQSDPLDFDGKITVTIEKPPQEEIPTKINKWGVQGYETATDGKTDAAKIYWTVLITGQEGSHIPGSTLTDQILSGDYLGAHHYTDSDMAAGLNIGVSEYDPVTGAAVNWHSWMVYPGDPGLTWTDTGWTYVMPETATCMWCGNITLGNQGWEYYVNYSSTPKLSSISGAMGYMNHVTIDGQGQDGWAEFVHGDVLADITKTGSFQGDASGGAFHWEFQVLIPGMQEGQKADYFWYVMDYMDVRSSEGSFIAYIENDADHSRVTATYNGTTINVPRIQDATANDPFVWHVYWSPDSNGIYYGRQLNLACRCNCTEQSCQFWNNGKCGSEYWFVTDDGRWISNGYCQCWTETENTLFTFAYQTNDLSIVEHYGGLGRQLRNEVVLYNMVVLPNGNLGGNQVADERAWVPIPGLFEKNLTQDFDGYTANYRITLNEAKLVLTDGSPLTIRDTMSETLAFINGSLVITTEDANGNTATLKQGVDYNVRYDGTGTAKDENGKPVHLLDIVILKPQPVMYTLDYDTTLIIPAGATQAIKYSNDATITLWGEDITDNSVEKVYADINIAAKNFKVEMFKTSALNGDPLGGATFGLYNEHGGQITTGVTDANGKLVFETNLIQGIVLREHVLYYLQELKAPPKYQLDETKYWFCFCDTDWGSCATCTALLNGLEAFRIPFEQIGRVSIQNAPIAYRLPETGGPGVYPMRLTGTVFVILPLVRMILQKRRKTRNT